MPKSIPERMTHFEMAVYLTNKGYDVGLNGKEYNEDLVTELAIEKECYEFHIEDRLWQLEEYNIEEEGFIE